MTDPCHVAVLADATQYPTTIWVGVADGISQKVGVTDGTGVPVEVRFDAAKFTPEQAQAWLNAQGMTPISFTPGVTTPGIGQTSAPGSTQGVTSTSTGESSLPPGETSPGGAMSAPADIRDIDARCLQVGVPSKYEDLPEGMLIRDVTLLTSGEWTDSAVQTPLFYPPDVLERYAGAWSRDGVYASHNTQNNGLRPVLEKVGKVLKPHAKGGAVVGDVLLHLQSQSSRDIAGMVKAGILNAVSVEHYGKERWNATSNRYEATELDFRGLAFVEQGACPGARINAALASKKVQEDNTMDNEAIQKELAAQKEAVATSLAEVTKKLAALDELTNKVADLEKAAAQRRSLAAGESKPKYDPLEGLNFDPKTGVIERA